MSDGSRPAVRAWNPEQWRLRWKVTAVLAVPLIVALVLGGLRISDETAESRRSNEAAEHIDVVTAAIGLESLTGTVIGGQASGTVAPDDLSRLDEAIGNVREVVDGADPGTAAALNSALDVARTIRADGSTSPAPLPELADRQHRIQADTVNVVEAAVQDIEDSTVSAAKTQLVNTLYAQRGLFDQTIGAIALMRDPNASPKDVAAGLFAEAAMVDTLARSYPDDDRRIADLRKGNANRTALVDQGLDTRVWPMLEMRESLLDSLSTYTTLLQNAAKAITSTVTGLADEAQRGAIRDGAIVLVALVAALALAVLVSRSLVAPIRRLREGALDIAEYELPDEVERIKLGDSVDDIRAEALPVHTTEEIGELARAVDDIHDQALRLAGEQAELRLQISEMFETLARRSKTLVDHQLTLIESMEFEEKDPRLLDRLFRLDHLATRMRRNGDNLLVLAGTPPRKSKSAPVAVVDILRAAMSEVEDYRRVKLGATPDLAIAGAAASDVVHLLSELLDNALRASPPASDVTFSFARAQDGGLVIEVSDRGVGIPAEEMDELNDRLARPAEVGPETARRMGLFVVGRLAERHGLKVRMRTTFESAADPGVTVMVYVPQQLIVTPVAGEASASGSPGGRTLPVQARNAVGRNALPESAAATGGLQQRNPGASNALPQRDPGTNGVPQRQSTTAHGLPKRQPTTATGLPQREPGTNVPPQRQPVPTSGLPQRQPGASGLPQRTPGANGLPLRETKRGAGESPQPARLASEPASRATDVIDPSPAAAPSAPDNPSGEASRHSVRTAKTASFFHSRLDPTEEEQANPPIFAEMVSAWLVDPTGKDASFSAMWESAADAGWSAARRAAEDRVAERTETGLPRRQPGRRLVPGGVDRGETVSNTSMRRNPDAIRNSLSRHQAGVRNGRAQRTGEGSDGERQ